MMTNNIKKSLSYDSSLSKIKNSLMNVNFQQAQTKKKCESCSNKDNNNMSSSKSNLARSSAVFLRFIAKLTKFKKEQKAAKTLAIVVGCLSKF